MDIHSATCHMIYLNDESAMTVISDRKVSNLNRSNPSSI
nr:MAG TPA: hypothetical protein [Caudoviricetes sp.]